MIPSGSHGFDHAPITKTILYTVGLVSTLAWIFDFKNFLVLKLGDIITMKLLKLWTHHFLLYSVGEALCAFVILHYLREVERRMGSSKYFGLVLSSLIVSTFIYFALIFAQIVFPSMDLILSGPYVLINLLKISLLLENERMDINPSFFSLRKYFAPHFRIRVAGFYLTDKIFIYVLVSQLLLSRSISSLVSGLIGILCGIVYDYERFGLSRLKAPHAIESFCSNYLEPWINPPPIQPLEHPIVSNRPFAQGNRRRRNAPGDVALASRNPVVEQPVQASEEHLQTLSNMGFPRESALEALLMTSNNIEDAVQYLLN